MAEYENDFAPRDGAEAEYDREPTEDAGPARRRPVQRTQQTRRSSRREKMLRRSKRRWRIFLVIYTLLFLAAGAAGCYVLYRFAGAYEASIPEHVMDDFMAETTEDQWYVYTGQGADLTVSGFESGSDLFRDYYDTAIRGRNFTYWKYMEEYSADRPVYKVRGGGVDLCLVYLTPKGQNAAGFGRQLWQVGEVRSIFSLDGLQSVTVEIEAPVDSPVYINGVAVDDACRAGTVPVPDMTELESRFDPQPVYTLYRVERMYGSITVTDAEGRVLGPRQEDGVLHYTVPPETLHSFTVRAPEPVTVTVSGAELTPADASRTEESILAGLEAYTGGQEYKILTYSFDGLYTVPEITGAGADGKELTPLIDEKGELIYLCPQDDALAEEVSGVAEEFFEKYISYSSTAYSSGRYHSLLSCILPGTDLYDYVRDSRDAMIWASATEVSYDELTFADFYPVGEDCFTCTIRYKADFDAQSWYTHYSYDLQNAYELAFVRVDGVWYAAAMSVIVD